MKFRERTRSILVLLLLAAVAAGLAACGGSGPNSSDRSEELSRAESSLDEKESARAESKNEKEEQNIWSLMDRSTRKFAKKFDVNDVGSLTYTFVGEGGAMPIVTEDKDRIQAVFDALNEIVIVKTTDMTATDYDDIFTFTTADAEYTVSFNMHHLEANGKYYLIEHDADLWTLANQIEKEYQAAEDTKRAEDEQKAEEEKKTEDESKTDEEKKTEDENKTDEEKKTEDDVVYATAESTEWSFRFEYDSAYLQTTTDAGQIDIWLMNSVNTQPYVEVGRKVGEDAISYLQARANEINAQYADNLTTLPEIEELTLFERDFYAIYSEVTFDDLVYVLVAYAEDYEDGTVMYYAATLEMPYSDYVSPVIATAIRTIEVFKLDDSKYSATPEPTATPKPTATPEPTATPGPAKELTVYNEGRWTWTFETLSNGDLEYCFDDVLLIDLPGDWDGKYFAEVDGEYIRFYHTDSYNAWKENYGYTGGTLFTLAHYTDDSYQDLPSYHDLGLAKDGRYVLIFPTDVQGYMDDQSIWQGWQDLYDDMDYVKYNSYSMLFS